MNALQDLPDAPEGQALRALPNWKLVLEYDGTDFEGWQAQPGDPPPRTVQTTLQAALEAITGGPVAVFGAGRTDAGVHAAGQVASVRAATRLGAEELHRALNAHLPRDVAVHRLEAAAPGFHARRDARSKLYVYRIWNAPVRAPLRERFALHVRGRLDLDALREGAASLVGTHDFASFRAAGGSGRTSVRTLSRVEWRGEAGGELQLEVEGTGFLRHMVRNLVGTLLEIGRGRRSASSLPRLLAARDRTLAGPTSPPHGLTLIRVDY
jgi:tRNA pseudouridine38-40 synthase